MTTCPSQRGWTPSWKRGSDTKHTQPPITPLLSAPVNSPAERGGKGEERLVTITIHKTHPAAPPGMFPPCAGNWPVKLSDLGNLGEFVRIPDLANLKQTEYLSTQNFPLSMGSVRGGKCNNMQCYSKTFNHPPINQFSEKIGNCHLSASPRAATRGGRQRRTNNRGK